MKSRSILSRKGFTLIEIIIVMGIFVIVIAFAVFISFDFYRSYAFRSERNILVSVLQHARSKAISNINQCAHGVRFESDKYVIFEAADAGCPSPAPDEEIQANPTANVTTDFGDTVTFSRLSGNVSASGDINLTSGPQTATISINNEGRINW
ncbi:MAG: GspH/FimT family pseudopilin [Candidatus Doudnabacteria bacterium]|nr:GspH/FimT family pseudopilin [Candidatus Doudnabacteria bacterium]